MERLLEVALQSGSRNTKVRVTQLHYASHLTSVCQCLAEGAMQKGVEGAPHLSTKNGGMAFPRLTRKRCGG